MRSAVIKRSEPLRSGTYLDPHPVDGVVRVATEVPIRPDGLLVAGGVGRPEHNSCGPGVASHTYVQPRHTPLATGAASSSASTQFVPPSVLTATATISATPDHARPVSVHSPVGIDHVRVKNSGTPGGIISERGIIRVRGMPSSDASCRKR